MCARRVEYTSGIVHYISGRGNEVFGAVGN